MEKDEKLPEQEAQEEIKEKAAAQPEKEESPKESEQSEGKSEKSEKKKLFGRNDKLEKSLKEAETKLAEATDRIQRQMAEFDNFRKRTEKEKQQMFSMGERSVIEKMLPIVDNFERGLAAIPAEEKEGPVASGMEMVYRQLLKQLEDLGVTPIEAVGKEFDPAFHNAVMQVESDEYESGTVAQEFQKGYKYHDTVIRYSMVGVVQ